MCRLFKMCAILILAALACHAGIHDAKALSHSEVTDVRISDDLRRVVARANGSLNPVHMYRLEGRNRLAILMPDVALGDVEHMIRNPKNPALSVNVSSSSAGVKLVLDFGKTAVPAFKITVIDNCLIALLGPKGSHAADSQDRSFSSPAGAAASPRTFVPDQQRKQAYADDTGNDDLTVCSAEVVNGVVILTVASKQHAGRTYRVKLGLNLDNLGFNSATIARVSEQSRTPRRMIGARLHRTPGRNDGHPFPAVAGDDTPGEHKARRMRYGSPNQRISPATGGSYRGHASGAAARGPVSRACPSPEAPRMAWN